MKEANHIVTIDGNEACAYVAYRLTELSAIYPITPSSPMGEWADEWSGKGIKNIWGTVPQVVELQSEGGASGTLHGALQLGALATTYTASQGLLLMIPNMYKIAGELTPSVIHVTARALAAQGLSIFGDHSDVMTARMTGFAMLASGSVQEAHDFAAIAHGATLKARIPFLHFFDGFRVSHEVNKISLLTNEQLHVMVDDDLIAAHRRRALNPEHPFIRGTAQNPDVYFQGREASNQYYNMVPEIVQEYMDRFAKIAGRQYKLVDYFGDAAAEKVIVVIGSGAKTSLETAKYLNKQGKKVGVLQINLYRPFPVEYFLKALPKTVRAIAVLDRTKEPGAAGEPLYKDVIAALTEALIANKLPLTNGMPKIIGGRFGLGSKEFTPAMVMSIFAELDKANPKNHFTIGINDDVTHTSLDYDQDFSIESEKNVRAIFFGLGADGTVGANKNTIKIIGEETDNYTQGYFVYDSKKSGSRTISHLRFGPEPIDAPYLIEKASFIACHQFGFLDSSNVLEKAGQGATFLLNSPYPADQVWEHLPRVIQQTIIDKKINFYVIDGYKVARDAGMGNRINTVMQTCFFAISGVLPRDEAIAQIKKAIEKTYKKKGEDVVKKNFAAVDHTLTHLHKVDVPAKVSTGARELKPTVSVEAPEFVQTVTAIMMQDRGDQLPVSKLPAEGTYPSGTTQWEKRGISQYIANWNPDMCIQCGQCGMICPHSVIRSKLVTEEQLKKAPATFKCAALKAKGQNADMRYHLQIYPEDCTGCGLCTAVCPAADKTNKNIKAIMLEPKAQVDAAENESLKFFETIPYNDRNNVDLGQVRNVQFLQPLFEFSGACAGCGETPYVRLLSQLFGDHMLVANATGCSSIYGGNLPTTPWCLNDRGEGPAWANSLFEDNAEFGFGFRTAIDKEQEYALELVDQLKDKIGKDLAEAVKSGVAGKNDKEISEQRERISQMKGKLQQASDAQAKQLLAVADYLVPRSVWMIGGDGWAYDIGYGGLDHVLASGKKIRILVLDTEVYSNTGGQSSKATPRAAVAKFAASGKSTARKDLGMIAASYGSIYVAQIAMGANPNQALKAIMEAEAYDGPSLVIAYSHCVAHGYDLKLGIDQQKLAVKSGFWPLYRYNPDRAAQGLNPFQLDSQAPSIPVQDYAYNEPRFKSLVANNAERAALLIKELQDDVNKRFALYKRLAEQNESK